MARRRLYPARARPRESRATVGHGGASGGQAKLDIHGMLGRAHHRGARGYPGQHRPARASPARPARKSLATRRGACNSPM